VLAWAKMRGNPDAGYQHSGMRQLVAMVAQHVLCQYHPGRPELPSASRLEVFVKLDWLVEEAREV